LQGIDCSMCPNIASKPTNCKDEEPIVWNGQVEESVHCPVLSIPEFTDEFEAFYFFGKNLLPYSGGYREQPARLITGLRVIANAQQQLVAEQKNKSD